MRIFKYPLKITDIQEIEMPEHAKILTIQTQNTLPCIWARVNPEGTIVKRKIRMYGTGHECECHRDNEYIGTFQLGSLAFHVFDLG